MRVAVPTVPAVVTVGAGAGAGAAALALGQPALRWAKGSLKKG
jgi:hypothetical protein